jgi:hypothetical protein
MALLREWLHDDKRVYEDVKKNFKVKEMIF